MTLIESVRYHLADKACIPKERQLKKQLVSEIAADMAVVYPNKTYYRETVFHYHTRWHYLSVNLMELINAVKQEDNLKLACSINVIVGDFTYIPDANSYCPPMIKLIIQSASILQPEKFANHAVDIEINNQRLERKLNRCYDVINKHTVSPSLIDLVKTIQKNPDNVPTQKA